MWMHWLKTLVPWCDTVMSDPFLQEMVKPLLQGMEKNTLHITHISLYERFYPTGLVIELTVVFISLYRLQCVCVCVIPPTVAVLLRGNFKLGLLIHLAQYPQP